MLVFEDGAGAGAGREQPPLKTSTLAMRHESHFIYGIIISM